MTFGRIDFQNELNPAQYEAVTTVDGPVLVVAGAGSGKTRTLVYRVAYLVERGITPEAILLLTFTRKAAGEMLARAGRLADGCAHVAGGTFHSLAHEMLRFWAPKIGYPTDFNIMDRGDMEELLGALRKDHKIGEKDKRFPKRGTAATIISKAANKNAPLADLMADEYPHLMDYLEPMVELDALYQDFKRQNARMDFDDLLIKFNQLLAEDDEARQNAANRFQYIMVDEYQDTNLVQADIIRRLAGQNQNVMVVGDDAQSIYSFRGATFKNIMEFPSAFKGARVIRLEENYRSRQPILDLTNRIIAGAREKYDKKLFTRRTGGQKPRILVMSSQAEQSEFICRKVKQLVAEGLEWSDMAVLFRAARHSFKLEVELTRQGIDYVKYGGRRFLESAHIKDLLSLLRVTANPRDGVSLTRALLMLDGVGPKAAARITDWVGGDRERLVRLADCPVSGRAKASVSQMADLFAVIAPQRVDLDTRVQNAWAFYQPMMVAKFDDYPSRERDVDEFLVLANSYTSLTRFLADMTLEPPNAAGPEGPGRLALSTIHSAKGLEYKAVFIIWATDGRFPAPYALDNPDSLDEERRLMYVAATRAEEYLYFTCPLEIGFEAGPMSRPRVSRFLSDLPRELYESQDRPSEKPPAAPKSKTASPPTTPNPTSAGGLKPGQRVSHPVFGLGKVVRVMKDRKIRVDFDHYGAKTLHLDFAGLKNTG